MNAPPNPVAQEKEKKSAEQPKSTSTSVPVKKESGGNTSAEPPVKTKLVTSKSQQVIEVLNPQVLTKPLDPVKIISPPSTSAGADNAKAEKRQPKLLDSTITSNNTVNSSKSAAVTSSESGAPMQKFYEDVGREDVEFREDGVVVLREAAAAATSANVSDGEKKGLFIRVLRWKWFDDADSSIST